MKLKISFGRRAFDGILEQYNGLMNEWAADLEGRLSASAENRIAAAVKTEVTERNFFNHIPDWPCETVKGEKIYRQPNEDIDAVGMIASLPGLKNLSARLSGQG
jgi:hypothetical protein